MGTRPPERSQEVQTGPRVCAGQRPAAIARATLSHHLDGFESRSGHRSDLRKRRLGRHGGHICPHEMHHRDVASIEKRVRGDGSVAFRVVWRDPTQPGKQSMTFDDRRQAEQTLKLLNANGQRLTLAVEVANAIRQGGPTVEDVVREHIDLLNRVGEDTRTGYRLLDRDHITPHLGALPVRALTWQQVTLWIRELQKKGLSNKSIANVHGLLSAAMNTAVRLGYRAENPCAAVRLPRNQRAGDDMVVLEPEELDLILDNTADHYRPFIVTLVGTGMRFGEATALHVEDLSLDAHPPTIRVNKAWKRDGERQPFLGAGGATSIATPSATRYGLAVRRCSGSGRPRSGSRRRRPCRSSGARR